MKNYLMINGKKIELTEEQVKILTEPKEEKQDVIHRANEHEVYYYIDEYFEVKTTSEEGCSEDKEWFEKGNYYLTECEDLAIQDALHNELRSRLRKFTRNHGWDDDFWNDFKKIKYCITYDKKNKEYFIIESLYIKRDNVYFISKIMAEQAIEKVIKPFIEEHKEFIW